MIIKIPYKSHNNKLILDFFTLSNKQLNNVNSAISINDTEAKEKNYVYLLYWNNSVYLYLSLSQRIINTDNFSDFLTFICELQDIEIQDCDINNSNGILYNFDIEKFNSTLSFTLDYKDRNIVPLYLTNSKVYYKVSDKVDVDFGTVINNTEMFNSIISNFNVANKTINYNKGIKIIDVENVDKNSPLIPFFNYKDCLNFSVAQTSTFSFLSKIRDRIYFNNLFYKFDDICYKASTFLRSDKFTLKIDSTENENYYVSPAIWQLLVILQNNKIWKNLECFTNCTRIKFNDNLYIFGCYKSDDNLILPSHSENINTNFELVGNLHSNELFMLNKFYSNAGRDCCYFDFSRQVFIGNNYVFNDDKNAYKETELSNPSKINSTLPLKLTFIELKHYIGSDLSQKNFNLFIYTDGVNIKLEKYNNESMLENSVIFNHTMSKSYLNI